MSQEIRLKNLLNKVKKKYKIKDKINLQIVNSKVEIKGNKRIILRDDTKKVRNRPLMAIYHYQLIDPKKAPTIEVYLKNIKPKIEALPNPVLEHILAHELVHFLIRKQSKEYNSKELRKILWKINKMIDHGLVIRKRIILSENIINKHTL